MVKDDWLLDVHSSRGWKIKSHKLHTEIIMYIRMYVESDHIFGQWYKYLFSKVVVLDIVCTYVLCVLQ